MIIFVTQNGNQVSQTGSSLGEVQSSTHSFEAAYTAQDQSVQSTIGNWTADTRYEVMVADMQKLMTGDAEHDSEVLAKALQVVETPTQMTAVIEAMVTAPTSLEERLANIIENTRQRTPTALANYLERLEKAKDELKEADFSSNDPEMQKAQKDALVDLDAEIARVKELIAEQIENSFLEDVKDNEHLDPNAMPTYAAMALAQPS